MEEKSELNNLLIERDENKFANLKKIILIGATMFIVFLVAIAIVRNMNSDKSQNSIKEENILPPEPVKEQSLAIDSKEKDSIFEQVPIRDDKTEKVSSDEDKFDKIVSEIKQRSEISKAKKPKMDDLDLEQTHSVAIPKESKKSQTEQPKETKNIKQLVEQIPNKPIQIVKREQTPKESVTKPINSAQKGGYYIQIGAFSKTPNDKFLQKITKSGFNYRLYNAVVNGKEVVKVLIGPYSSKSDANSDINRIKEEFKVKPFIFRL